MMRETQAGFSTVQVMNSAVKVALFVYSSITKSFVLRIFLLLFFHPLVAGFEITIKPHFLVFFNVFNVKKHHQLLSGITTT